MPFHSPNFSLPKSLWSKANFLSPSIVCPCVCACVCVCVCVCVRACVCPCVCVLCSKKVLLLVKSHILRRPGLSQSVLITFIRSGVGHTDRHQGVV